MGPIRQTSAIVTGVTIMVLFSVATSTFAASTTLEDPLVADTTALDAPTTNSTALDEEKYYNDHGFCLGVGLLVGCKCAYVSNCCRFYGDCALILQLTIDVSRCYSHNDLNLLLVSLGLSLGKNQSPLQRSQV